MTTAVNPLNSISITEEEATSFLEHYLKLRSTQGAYAYGFTCEECGGSVVARDRQKLVRKDADRTLCWDCMDKGVSLYLPLD